MAKSSKHHRKEASENAKPSADASAGTRTDHGHASSDHQHHESKREASGEAHKEHETKSATHTAEKHEHREAKREPTVATATEPRAEAAAEKHEHHEANTEAHKEHETKTAEHAAQKHEHHAAAAAIVPETRSVENREAKAEEPKSSKVSHVSRDAPAEASQNPWLIASIVLAVLLIGSLLTGGFQHWSGLSFSPGFGGGNVKISKEFNLDGAYAQGAKNAPVTMIEYSDFQCPYCEQFFTNTEPQIYDKYIKTGKVKLVYKNFPLSIHQNAEHAAEAALCAGDQGQFFAYHDKLFGNQPKWVNLADPTDQFVAFAQELGLNTSKFRQCYTSGKHAQDVQNDFNEGSQAGVRGTPTFFINGQMISGAQSFSVFEKAIDAALNGSNGSQPTTQPTTPTQAANPTTPQQVSFNMTGQYVRGSDLSAPVQIIEYSDYQCPYCERWFSTVEPQLTSSYLNAGKAALVYKEFPLYQIHPNAENGANAAECAGVQGKYWQMHDLLFQNQSTWSVMGNPIPELVKYAKSLGLDATSFQSCLTNTTYQSRIDAEQQEGISNGVTGTPTAYIIAPNAQVNKQALIAAQQSDGQGGYFIRYVATPDNRSGLMIVGAQPYSIFQSALKAVGA